MHPKGVYYTGSLLPTGCHITPSQAPQLAPESFADLGIAVQAFLGRLLSTGGHLVPSNCYPKVRK